MARVVALKLVGHDLIGAPLNLKVVKGNGEFIFKAPPIVVPRHSFMRRLAAMLLGDIDFNSQRGLPYSLR